MFATPRSLTSYKTCSSALDMHNIDSYERRDIECSLDSAYAVSESVAVVPVSRSPSPKPTAARAPRTLVRQRSLSNCPSSYGATPIQHTPLPYGRNYNVTTSSDSYEAHCDTIASSHYCLLRNHSSSPQPLQQQARRGTESFRRRVHSPYSAVRRPANANHNCDQHLDDQTLEVARINKASFRQKRRKALCIGINYKGQERELRGCVNDAWNISEFLKSFWNYSQEDIMVLTDELYLNPKYMPTKQNILNALRWLVKDAQPGDCLFFHYSGHGGRITDFGGDRVDGSEKAIHPADWESAGEIVSEVLYNIMVKPLPAGCRLTALFDSCHSGTVLDLPYIYQANGRLKSHGMTLAKYPRAHVVLFAGCSGLQSSGGIIRGGEFLGAMSSAFISSLTVSSSRTYLQVLASVKDILRRTQRQTPQLSSSYPIDGNRHCLL